MKRALAVVVLLLAGIVTACGAAEEATTTSTQSATTTSGRDAMTSTTRPATTTTQPAPTSTTQAPKPTTTTAGTTTTSLAGKEIDFGPAEGDILMVIGVRYDDVLNMRTGPGVGSPIVAGIAPTFTGLEALGNTRELSQSLWIQVDYEGTEGWVHMGYVGYEGITDDMTSFVVDQLGDIPAAATMEELGEMIAAVFASEEPESDIVQVTPVTNGDLAEVTYDVVGLGDDAVRGLRLHLFANEVDGEVSLMSLETTTICGRGIDAEGLCP